MFIYWLMIFINLILIGLCFYKGNKFSGIYLSVLVLGDILRKCLQFFYIGLPVPYTGIALALFSLHNLIYLITPILLLKICFKATSADSGYLPELLGISASIFSIYIYPAIRGASLVLGFNLFSLLIYLFCSGCLLNYFTKVKASKDQLILLIISMGCLANFILLLVFHSWLVILIGNVLYDPFYS